MTHGISNSLSKVNYFWYLLGFCAKRGIEISLEKSKDVWKYKARYVINDSPYSIETNSRKHLQAFLVEGLERARNHGKVHTDSK